MGRDALDRTTTYLARSARFWVHDPGPVPGFFFRCLRFSSLGYGPRGRFIQFSRSSSCAHSSGIVSCLFRFCLFAQATISLVHHQSPVGRLPAGAGNSRSTISIRQNWPTREPETPNMAAIPPAWTMGVCSVVVFSVTSCRSSSVTTIRPDCGVQAHTRPLYVSDGGRLRYLA